MACDYCFAADGAPHNTGCKYATGVTVIRRSKTENYPKFKYDTDAQLARDIEAARGVKPAHDSVNHPSHYTSHPSGIEAIQVTEHMGFCIGNAIKYLWRADLKGNAVEDLRKALWYVEREIQKRTR